MRNIRELSIGSIVSFFEPDATEYICRVLAPTEGLTSVVIIDIVKNDIGSEPEFKIGAKKRLPKGRINGVFIEEKVLRKIGFIEPDERAWKLMYYFGDMRLYYKYDKKIRAARFKFKPDFTQKRWVRIDCLTVHHLQNIMRFLTGGELEFEYKRNVESNEKKDKKTS